MKIQRIFLGNDKTNRIKKQNFRTVQIIAIAIRVHYHCVNVLWVVDSMCAEEYHLTTPPSPLGSWSASTSPARSPSPSRYHHGAPHDRGPGGAHHQSHHHSAAHRSNRQSHLQFPMYGTTSLGQRSRSPSPARLQEMRERNSRFDHDEMGTIILFHQLSIFISFWL